MKGYIHNNDSNKPHDRKHPSQTNITISPLTLIINSHSSDEWQCDQQKHKHTHNTKSSIKLPSIGSDECWVGIWLRPPIYAEPFIDEAEADDGSYDCKLDEACGARGA